MKAVSNIHVHSNWCDGADAPDDIIRVALKKGFTDLGFSSHAHAPFDSSCPGIKNEDKYINDIMRVKIENEGRITALCGVEQDCLTPIDRRKYDYTILSSHYFPEFEGRYDPVDESFKSIKETLKCRYSGNGISMLNDYFSFLTKGVIEQKPDVVGHFDLVAKFNNKSLLFDERSKEYINLSLIYLEEILNCINGYGGMIEVNTSRIKYREDRYPYAGTPYMLKVLKDKKARVIITTDCHSADTLDYMYPETVQLLKENGLSSMSILKNGKFVDVNI